MPKYTKFDRTGQRWHRLVALEFVPTDDKYATWLFQCDCGNTHVAMIQSVMRGFTKSCGCYGREAFLKRITKHGKCPSKNNSGVYKSWRGMMGRSGWLSHPTADRYGAKGIDVDERWFSFENFYADMGDRPPGHSIDRIDNRKPYGPGNCRWATQAQQCANTSRNIRFMYKGELLCLAELCRREGLKYSTVQGRVHKQGYTYEQALLSMGVNAKHVPHYVPAQVRTTAQPGVAGGRPGSGLHSEASRL